LETFPENSALTAFKRHLLRIQQRTPEQWRRSENQQFGRVCNGHAYVHVNMR
jgi:hypothetical protein